MEMFLQSSLLKLVLGHLKEFLFFFQAHVFVGKPDGVSADQGTIKISPIEGNPQTFLSINIMAVESLP
jgi:hypothetical protein